MRLLRAGQRIARRLNCGVMWPDPEQGWCTEASVFACRQDSSFTRRNARNRILISSGERRCIVQGVSGIGFGALGRVFVYRGANAGRSYGRTVLSR